MKINIFEKINNSLILLKKENNLKKYNRDNL